MELNIVSKHRAAIYGVAILLVILFHGSIHHHIDYTFGIAALQVVQFVIDTGAIGVEIFLFMSGISLYFSFTRNGDILAFYKKRFWRVVPAVWILFGWYWAELYLVEQFAPADFASRMMLIEFFTMNRDLTMWYISFILALYLAFPIIYTYLFGRGRAGVRLIVLVALVCVAVLVFREQNPTAYAALEIALTRIPVFLIGCWFGKLVHQKKRVPKWVIPLVFVAVVAFFAVLQAGVLHSAYRRFFCAFGGIALCYAIALVCEGFAHLGRGPEGHHGPIYRFLAWSGGLSLELFVSHVMLFTVFGRFFASSWYVDGQIAPYLVVIAGSYVLSVLVSKLVGWLQRKLTRKAAE